MSLKNIIKSTALFRYYVEYRLKVNEKKRFEKEASEYIEKSVLSDYRKCYKRYRISPSEYMQYDFIGKNDSYREEFISRSMMQKVYRQLVDNNIRGSFYNKVDFLLNFKSYINRKWIVANDKCDIEKIKNILIQHDVVVKPIEGSLGEGIYKIKRNEIKNIDELSEKLIKENVLIEECIKACPEIEEFHPSSLNTIRVVTISNGEKSEVLGSFIRFGCHGNVVDNAHAGGVFATIDIKTGKVISNGLDTDGNEYEVHPDSNKIIKGFMIPNWNKVKDVCERASRHISELKFCGWDCVVLPSGEVDIIEGNHGPDVDVMQSPLKNGIKQLIKTKLLEYFNYKL